MTVKERSQGCLVGGAAGDALGYAVEFMSLNLIRMRYGSEGITSYAPRKCGLALISDDTQMTLFTAEGLLRSSELTRKACCASVAASYKDWFLTQNKDFPLPPEQAAHSALLQRPELFDRRAPGLTCLNAIEEGCCGTTAKPANHSKGCGAVMRVAPVGLFLPPEKMPEEECDRLGADISALTHGHDLGWLPGAALVHMIRRLTYTACTIQEAASSAVKALQRFYPNAPHFRDLAALIEQAMALAETDIPIEEAVRMLGEGWVGEEALAIAICCAVRHEDDFAAGLCASVNHSGDSDSTGAVCGNLLGARLGLGAIPEKFKTNLELFDVLMDFGARLVE